MNIYFQLYLMKVCSYNMNIKQTLSDPHPSPVEQLFHYFISFFSHIKKPTTHLRILNICRQKWHTYIDRLPDSNHDRMASYFQYFTYVIIYSNAMQIYFSYIYHNFDPFTAISFVYGSIIMWAFYIIPNEVDKQVKSVCLVLDRLISEV